MKAGLFSAINTAFIIAMNPNPSDTTNILLTQLIQANTGVAAVSDPPMLPQTVMWSQPLAYASLSLSLLAAFGAILGKQWLAHYKSTRFGHGSLEERGLQRQNKLHGLERWRLDAVLQSFPVLLQLSLLIFAVALSAYVWTQQVATFRIMVAATGTGILFYSSIVAASLVSPDCPFQTPASAVIRLVWGIVLHTLIPSKKPFKLGWFKIFRTQLGYKSICGECVKHRIHNTLMKFTQGHPGCSKTR